MFAHRYQQEGESLGKPELLFNSTTLHYYYCFGKRQVTGQVP